MNRIVVALIMLLCVFVPVDAKMTRRVNYKAQPSGIVKVDSVDYRKNLTRVYCKIFGQPHTSMKITEISGATDIDGIDFARWFQFEEKGMIPIEIDFCAKDKQKFNFVIYSTKGQIACEIK